jgi:hypothetical protein
VTPLEMAISACFHRPMQALSDDQQIERLEGRMDRFDGRMDRLEKKVDDGFAEGRKEIAETRREMKAEITSARDQARADHRTLLGAQLTTAVTMILGFVGLILQHGL